MNAGSLLLKAYSLPVPSSAIQLFEGTGPEWNRAYFIVWGTGGIGIHRRLGIARGS